MAKEGEANPRMALRESNELTSAPPQYTVTSAEGLFEIGSDIESVRARASHVDTGELIVVGIGASAGGVEALEQFFSKIPSDTGMAFIVVQHLSPDVESLMHQILARRTEMPVHKIEGNITPVPNHVYVLPSGVQARVEGLDIVGETPSQKRQQNPIDLLFCTLAASYKENACGIVLSGTGSDGALGIRKIHENNGLTVVQSETSSKFTGMPRAAISTGVVDAILCIEEIPDALVRFREFATRRTGCSLQSVFSVSMNAENRIKQLLHRKFGINFDSYKQGMFGRRVARRVSLSGMAGVETYLQKLELDHQELNELYNDLLIGVTEFFRDPSAFDELQHRVLPALVESVGDHEEFRIWIAPCATGEEAYSIGILIDELIRQRNLTITYKIFATDVNASCIDFASKGTYPKNRLRNISRDRLAKYFVQEDDEYKVIPRLRKKIIFAKHDLLNDAPFTRLDLVCCRNLLIYFNDSAKKKALSLFNFSLRSSGGLFLGPSESVTSLDLAFETLSEKWRIYRKSQNVKFSQVDMSVGNPAQSWQDKNQTDVEGNRQKELFAAYDSLLSAYIPPGLLIDDDERVMHIFGDFGKYLQPNEGRPKDRILDLLPGPLKAAAVNALKRAKIEDKPAIFPGIEIEEATGIRMYKMVVMPVHNRFSAKYLLTVEQHEPLAELPLPAEVDTSELSGDSSKLITTLEQELHETRESLHDSILNLKSANEEMQTTNEELIASNEELQSTNEELHSVNEELYTVNSEYQRKISELTELTDDMDNLLDSLRVDTVYLDRNLAVRKFTLGIANTFKLLPQDVGRHFGSFNHNLKCEELIPLIESVVQTEKAKDKEIEDSDGNWYLMRLLPYSSRGTVEGVLLTLIDISKMKSTEQRLLELSEIVQASDDAIFKVTLSGEIRTWNRGARDLFLHQAKAIIGKKLDALCQDDYDGEMLTNALDQIHEGEQVNHVELKAVRRNGEVFDVQCAISPIYNTEGNIDSASVVLRDISTQKKAELQIRDEVKRRDHFLAVLSHELRNPTAAITNALSIVRKSKFTNAAAEKAIGIIHEQSRQLAKMLDDLLHVSRVTHNKFRLHRRRIDVCQAARSVVQSLEHRLKDKGQILSLEIPNEPLWAFVDETRLIQAQTNLLINASKYTPKLGHINYSIWLEDDSVKIEIQDDGEGMSPELLERVFEVFVQADQPLDRTAGGMGLGLPLVKMIAEAHGGFVSAKSDGVDRGSALCLTIPTGNLSLQTEENTGDQFAPDLLQQKKLLLVEDNDGAREMLSEYLMLEGLEVSTACNGIEAIRVYDKVAPAICIVDIGLPDLNGFEVAGRIRDSKHQPDLLIALTGYGQEKDRTKVSDAGFDLHLVKPMDPEELLATVAQHLGNKK